MFQKCKVRQLHAIRLKCLDCSAFQEKEVRLCPVTDCPLYPYRMGHIPKTKIPTIKFNVAKAKLLKIFMEEGLEKKSREGSDEWI